MNFRGLFSSVPMVLIASTALSQDVADENLRPFIEALPEQRDGLSRQQIPPSDGRNRLTVLYTDDDALRSASVALSLPSHFTTAPEATANSVISESLDMFTEDYREPEAAEFETPGGTPLSCRSGRIEGARAATMCFAEISGRILQLHTTTQIDPNGNGIDEDVLDAAFSFSSEVTDLLTPVAQTNVATDMAPPAAETDGRADDPPNIVQGIVTNAFSAAFPMRVEDLTQLGLKTNPAEGTVSAEYGNDDDTRNVRILLFPLSEDGIAGTLERSLASYGSNQDILAPPTSLTSPEGIPMDCFVTRSGELGYNICVAEIRGRGVRAQIGAVVDPQAEALPEDISDRDRELAGVFMDKLQAAPDQPSELVEDIPLDQVAEAVRKSQPSQGGQPVAPQDTPFARALPKSIDGRNRKEITVRGPRETYVATYEDDSAVQTRVTLFADHGDDPAELREFQKELLGKMVGELRDVEVTSPEGLAMQCFHSVEEASMTHSICTASLDA